MKNFHDEENVGLILPQVNYDSDDDGYDCKKTEIDNRGLMGGTAKSRPQDQTKSWVVPTLPKQIFALAVVTGAAMVLWTSEFLVVNSRTSQEWSAPVILTCPTSNIPSSKNFDERDENWYTLDKDNNESSSSSSGKHHRRSQPILDENFLKTYRHSQFDGHHRNFEEWKESMYPFMRDYFVPHLKNGDSVYESACGLGLSLYALLEVLQEETGIGNVTVYGNEYLEQNALTANLMLEELLPAQKTRSNVSPNREFHVNHNGGICHGDSTDLSYVPENSFDLVFTGYITPLFDPLGWGCEREICKRQIRSLCKLAASQKKYKETKQESPNEKIFSSVWSPNRTALEEIELLQRNQEAWYAKWTEEMIRIAKPGAPVMVADVPLPICESPKDNGGIAQDFWYRFAKESESLESHMVAFSKRAGEWAKSPRYHVALQKKRNDDN